MNEGAALVYHGFSGPGMHMGHGQNRQNYNRYHREAVQSENRSRGGGSPQQGHRRWQPRRNRQHQKGNNSAFGYDSDDSSLSSNASGSNKSSEKGDSDSKRDSGTVSREWRARNRREHKPRRIGPERVFASTYPFQVKFTPEDLLTGSIYDNLSQEIWDKFMKSQQTEQTFRKKMNLWRYLYITIKSIFPRYGLYVVGSTMSGFGLDSSDMDLCLFVRAPPHVEPRAHALAHLHYILNYIRAFDPEAELIQAKVPILKFARAGVQVDLNCNNVVGIRNTTLLYNFSCADWRVRPLVAAAKLWARAHRINDARRRTLSSYALTLMVIHFLQYTGVLPSASEIMSESASRSHNRTPLGELFLQFLRYYADFPYDKMAVSVRVGARIPISECRVSHLDPHQWKHVCVEEPFDLTNTARSVYDPETFEKIVKAFRESYLRLSACPRLAEAWPKER